MDNLVSESTLSSVLASDLLRSQEAVNRTPSHLDTRVIWSCLFQMGDTFMLLSVENLVVVTGGGLIRGEVVSGAVVVQLF